MSRYQNRQIHSQIRSQLREAYLMKVQTQAATLLLVPFMIASVALDWIANAVLCLIGALILSQTINRLDGALPHVPDHIAYWPAFGACVLVMLVVWLIKIPLSE
jgi:hypothetical protein